MLTGARQGFMKRTVSRDPVFRKHTRDLILIKNCFILGPSKYEKYSSTHKKERNVTVNFFSIKIIFAVRD